MALPYKIHKEMSQMTYRLENEMTNINDSTNDSESESDVSLPTTFVAHRSLVGRQTQKIVRFNDVIMLIGGSFAYIVISYFLISFKKVGVQILRVYSGNFQQF